MLHSLRLSSDVAGHVVWHETGCGSDISAAQSFARTAVRGRRPELAGRRSWRTSSPVSGSAPRLLQRLKSVLILFASGAGLHCEES